MSLVSRLKTFLSGEILTATDLNAEFNNALENLNPTTLESISSNVSEFQTTEDPGEVGSENVPATLRGEIRRLRTLIQEITGKTQWYESPDRNLTNVFDSFISDTASSSTGLQTISPGASYTNLTNQVVSVTITNTGRPIVIGFLGVGEIISRGTGSTTQSSIRVDYTINGGSNTILTSVVGEGDQSISTVGDNPHIIPAGAIQHVIFPSSAGTYEFTFSGRITNGGSLEVRSCTAYAYQV